MAQGITIRITRILDVRERRKDEVGLRIWTGARWVRACSLPCPPSLAADCGIEPTTVTTTIEFPPHGVFTRDAFAYRKNLLPEMRKIGVIK